MALADCTYTNNAHIYNTYGYEKQQAETSDYLRWSHEDVIVCARYCSASNIFISTKVSTHQAAIKNLMHKCICRLDEMENSIINVLTNPNKSCTLTYICFVLRHLRCKTLQVHFLSGLCFWVIVFTVLMKLSVVLCSAGDLSWHTMKRDFI